MIDVRGILDLLPHRFPFLLIDRVLDVQPGKFIRALKNVSMNEPYFAGHFPQRPVMPGVLIIEAMAQAAGVLAYVTANERHHEGPIHYLAGIDNARFKRVVEPGDQLDLRVTVQKVRLDIAKFSAEALVDGELACRADFMSIRKEIVG